MSRPITLYVAPVQGWCVVGKIEGVKPTIAVSPIFAQKEQAEAFLNDLLDDEDEKEGVDSDA